MEPLKYLFEKPMISDYMLAATIDRVRYHVHHAERSKRTSSSRSPSLVAHPIPDYQSLKTEFPNEHILTIWHGGTR